MAGFGYGFGSQKGRRPKGGKGKDPVPVGPMEPGASWNGTAGSGFGTPPSDPTRTKAKPAMRLIVPPNQYFTDTLTIGVAAAANDRGSLLNNLGLTKVTCHFEGASRDISAPTFRTFTDSNGNNVTYYAWWITIAKPASTAGHAHVYFEAVPADNTMQNRVIGPYQFSPVATLYDFDVTVALTSGADYNGANCIQSAMIAFKNGLYKNGRITIIESGTTYDIANSVPTYAPDGYLLIEPANGVSATFSKATRSTGTSAQFRSRLDRLWLRNLTFEMENVSHIRNEGTGEHVAEGCTFQNAATRENLWHGGVRELANVIDDAPYFLECTFSDLNEAFRGASLARGCTATNGYKDIFSGCKCWVGNTVDDWTSEFFWQEMTAFTVQYTGAGSNATIEVSGNGNSSSRTYTVKVDTGGGLAIPSGGQFTVSGTVADFFNDTGKTRFSDVVDWLNGVIAGDDTNTLADFSATLSDNTRRAVYASLAGGKATTIAPQVCTSAIPIYSTIDLHGDVATPDGVSENILGYNNKITNNVTQWLLSATNNRDFIYFNNILQQRDDPYGVVVQAFNNAQSQSHVVIAHWSVTGLAMGMRTDTTYNGDSYCAYLNNVAVDLDFSGAVDNDVTIDGNHLFTGATPASTGTNQTTGGTKATLFTDEANGDLTPAGDLLTNLKTPAVQYDLAGNERSATDAAGALST